MTLADLARWITAATLFASGGHRALPSAFVGVLVTQIVAHPLFADTQQDAALMSSLAWMEGGNQPAIVGDCWDKAPGDPTCSPATAQSWCVYQIYLPRDHVPGSPTAKTIEGWSGPDLIADPAKCITVARRRVRDSILSKENKSGACPLCVYARGRYSPEAQKLSDHRMNLAKRLIAEVGAP